MKPSAFLLTAISLTVLLPKAASAQEQAWLADRRYREGIGIRVGDLELHPGVAAEFGYDSNYYRRSSHEDPVGSLRLRLTPSFSLATLGAQRRDTAQAAPPPDVEFRADISATYNEFFPVAGTPTDRSNLHDSRNIGGNLGLHLSILPRRPWSGILYGDLGRAINPTNQGTPTENFNRLTGRAGGEIIFTPGGGLLDWRLGYDFDGTFFENFAQISNIVNTVTTRGRFRFLPRTAVLYDAEAGFITYPSSSAGGFSAEALREKTSSHPIRARLGVNGLVTQSFAVLAMAGWGASFYTGLPAAYQEDFDSVIGQLELKWFLTPAQTNDPQVASTTLSSLSIGFDRDFVDSYIGTYYARNRGYLNFSYFFGGKFLASLEGGAAANVYPTLLAYNYTGFTDVRLDATAFGEYRFKDRFGINATVRYGQNVSGAALTTKGTDGRPDAVEELAWTELEAYLGVRWFL